MKKIVILIGLMCFCQLNFTWAQHASFMNSGIIEYEVTVNTFAILQKAVQNDRLVRQQLLDKYKTEQAQFKTLKATLKFSQDKSIYSNALTTNGQLPYYFSIPFVNEKRIIYHDLSDNKRIEERNVGLSTYLLSDSLTKIKWKYTNETRIIAGYNCVRANGLVLDSIYVVAFYAEQIPSKNGPSIFHGLPGMILGLVLPSQHVSWFATKVQGINIPESAISPPSKGKPIDNKGYIELLNINNSNSEEKKYQFTSQLF